MFQLQALQIWRTKGQEDWQQCYGNVYFHLKILCLQLHNNELTIEHVTMAADTFGITVTRPLALSMATGLAGDNS